MQYSALPATASRASHAPPLHVHYTLFLGELATSQAGEDGSFIVHRPPGATVSATHARLLGHVSPSASAAEGWLLLDDGTAALPLRMPSGSAPIPEHALLEAVGELAPGGPSGHAAGVHLRVEHFYLHRDAAYSRRRWRAMREQRAAEGAEPCAPPRHQPPCLAAPPAALPPATPPGCSSACSLREVILGVLARAADGALLSDLQAAAAAHLQAMGGGQGNEGAAALERELEVLEEEFVVYRNEGQRYCQL
ncbi:hypothetical protein AB1Y20_021511 [Prymnesium parvum]|uniref:FHA domain-containing protein n=1 Tax=Prymnesium parvum TaxID=97485 RepID=A0AB34JLR2_PRYPA